MTWDDNRTALSGTELAIMPDEMKDGTIYMDLESTFFSGTMSGIL